LRGSFGFRCRRIGRLLDLEAYWLNCHAKLKQLCDDLLRFRIGLTPVDWQTRGTRDVTGGSLLMQLSKFDFCMALEVGSKQSNLR
jgi:hypothetical protein